MNNLTTIRVQVAKEDKEKANKILKSLGLSINTYLNMAIKQLIKTNGIPFEVVNPKPSRELLKALKETDKITKNNKHQGYDNMEELIKSLNKE